MSNPAETCTAPASHLIERLEAEKQLAEWHKIFGHLSKDADTAGNMINEGIAERDAEIALLKDMHGSLVVEKNILQASIDCWLNETHGMKRAVYNTNLYLRKKVAKYQNENAALRAEVERLKEENSHLWVRVESGEAAAYEQGKAEARKQAATEIIEEVIGDWNCDCGPVIADAIKVKFGLEVMG